MIDQLNDFKNFISYQSTWHFRRFVRLPQRVIGLFCGNQAMKTSATAFQYVMRVFGIHPVPKKNVVYFECSTRNKDNLAPHGYHRFKEMGVITPGWEKGTWTVRSVPQDLKCTFCGAPIVIHKRTSQIFRFASENLPGETPDPKERKTADTAEVRNSTYPEFKKWLPPFLIKKDLRHRAMSMTLHDPLNGLMFGTGDYKIQHAGRDIVVEFVSYSQTVQAGAGVQRLSTWCDEEPSAEFWEEQIPRLFAEDGDLILSLTPANKMSWSFDDVYEKAQVYYRSQYVCDFLNKENPEYFTPRIQVTDSADSIGCVQVATDDNPTLSPQTINELFDGISDPDTLATRRYGIHRQVSGRIFKDFDYKVHFISRDTYFPDGMFHDYNHFLLIDYHEHNPWAIIFVSLSPFNEAFVWWEWAPSPEKNVTRVIAQEIAHRAHDYKFQFSMIDPLASKTQTNTGTSVIHDLNEYFWEFKREGICGSHYFEGWDTKSTRGRDSVRERLKWAKIIGKPFNNMIAKDGRQIRVPTLWILNDCKETARSLKQWRMEEWNRSSDNVNKERKETPSQKFSHFCMCLEAAMKDNRFRPPARHGVIEKIMPKYFQGR